MTGIKPNFDDWSKISAIEVHEIAVLMHGFDPRALADVVVCDPHNPTSHYGTSPDTSWEVKMLITAVETGELLSAPANVAAPDTSTMISRTTLVPWLRLHGYVSLADGLLPSNGSTQKVFSGQSPPLVNEPERRLKALRDLGGEAKWLGRNGGMKWRITKIVALTAQEAHAGFKRNSEKTIRKDLYEAADAERLAKNRGVCP